MAFGKRRKPARPVAGVPLPPPTGPDARVDSIVAALSSVFADLARTRESADRANAVAAALRAENDRLNKETTRLNVSLGQLASDFAQVHEQQARLRDEGAAATTHSVAMHAQRDRAMFELESRLNRELTRANEHWTAAH